jgi:hypothetical protein
MTLGDQTVIPPAVVDGAKDELVIDVRDLQHRAVVAENNRRAALLMAVDGEEFP